MHLSRTKSKSVALIRFVFLALLLRTSSSLSLPKNSANPSSPNSTFTSTSEGLETINGTSVGAYRQNLDYKLHGYTFTGYVDSEPLLTHRIGNFSHHLRWIIDNQISVRDQRQQIPENKKLTLYNGDSRTRIVWTLGTPAWTWQSTKIVLLILRDQLIDFATSSRLYMVVKRDSNGAEMSIRIDASQYERLDFPLTATLLSLEFQGVRYEEDAIPVRDIEKVLTRFRAAVVATLGPRMTIAIGEYGRYVVDFAAFEYKILGSDNPRAHVYTYGDLAYASSLLMSKVHGSFSSYYGTVVGYLGEWIRVPGSSRFRFYTYGWITLKQSSEVKIISDQIYGVNPVFASNYSRPTANRTYDGGGDIGENNFNSTIGDGSDMSNNTRVVPDPVNGQNIPVSSGSVETS